MDNWATSGGSVTAPAQYAADVTPSDSADLAMTTRGLYVGVAGNVKITLAGGSTVTLTDLASGVVHPLRVSRVWSTDTTATGIVAVW